MFTLLNILKSIDITGGKKAALLQEDEDHLFGKTFRSQLIEIERSKKSLRKFLRLILRKILPFGKALCLTKTNCKVEGDKIILQSQVTKTKTKISNFKTTRVQVLENFIMQVQHQMGNTSFEIQKDVPVTSSLEQFALIKIATLGHVHPTIT